MYLYAEFTHLLYTLFTMFTQHCYLTPTLYTLLILPAFMYPNHYAKFKTTLWNKSTTHKKELCCHLN